MRLLCENDEAEIASLERRMAAYYADATDYTPYGRESWHKDMWGEIATRLQASPKSMFRIVEMGAGRSGLGRFLAECHPELRRRVHLCCQDVTEANRRFLGDWCDEVFIGSSEDITGEWDVVTHAYVLEHVARPRRFLLHAIDLLAPGGFHIFQCPRYDFPFYTPPALDHLSWPRKALCAARLAMSREDFRLVGDPALFHLPFHRDRDAIHLVSKAAVWNLCRGRVRVAAFPLPAGGLRDRFLKNFLTLRVVMSRDSL